MLHLLAFPPLLFAGLAYATFRGVKRMEGEDLSRFDGTDTVFREADPDSSGLKVVNAFLHENFIKPAQAAGAKAGWEDKRERFEQGGLARTDCVAEYRDDTIQVDGHTLHGRWTLVDGYDPDRRILYLHGGAFTVGSDVSHRPIAVDGPLVSIRKFSKSPLTLDKLVGFHAIPDCVAQFLWAACKARVTILISGGTGSGKTTLLTALSQSISHKERLITIEDAAELQLQQPHVARMETRPPNIEGKGEIRQRGLVKNALRMRPDRVILGEVRGEEAFDMLQAMNTGHEGSMATLHANTPRDAITRLEQMVAMGDMKITPEAVAGQIASAVGLIVQAQRLSDGQRKITSVAEVTGMEGAIIQMQEIFNYTRTGTGPNHSVIGEFRATGIRPKCLDEITTRDIPLPEGLFEPRTIASGPTTELTLKERLG